MPQFQFDARNVAPDTGIPDPVPDAWYDVAADKSELKPTSTGSGAYLEYRFNILNGKFAGQKLFHRFNVRNTSQKALDIAHAQLSAFQHAIGVLYMENTEQLHNLPLKVKAVVIPAQAEMNEQGQPTGKVYPAKNEIKAFRNVNDQSVQTGPAAAATGITPPPVTQNPQAAQSWQQQPQQPAQQPAYAPPAQQPQYAPPAQQFQPPPVQPPAQQYAPQAQPQQYAPQQPPVQGAPQYQTAPPQVAPQQPAYAPPQGQPQAPAASNPSQPWAQPGAQAPWGAPQQ